MKKLKASRSTSDFKSFRAEKVKSLFNAESGANFEIEIEADLDFEWKLGVIVGPSGSGKSTLGSEIFGGGVKIYEPSGWDNNKPIIDCIAPSGSIDDATSALSAVGLGSVPSWLKPYGVLSNGEKFRADMAKILCDEPNMVVIDEFTSVIDRQVARFGSLAFQKAWRRTSGKAVLLSCHYDVLEWLEPDWVIDTSSKTFNRGSLWRRPKFTLEIEKVDQKWWPIFKPHYYLDLPNMIAAEHYVGFVEGVPVCHVGVSPKLEVGGVRASRLVVMPEWQGAGVGLRFLETVLDHYVKGESKYGDRVKAAYFHTSHPALCAAFRRSKKWSQVSCELYGGNKARSAASLNKARSAASLNKAQKNRKDKKGTRAAGYGGHFRAVQGFKYHGSNVK